MNVLAGNAVRVLAVLTAAFALGATIKLALAPKGTTGMVAPWRYWGCAAGILIETTGIYYRISLFGEDLNARDVTFLLINVCIAVCVVGLLFDGGKPRP